MSENRIYHLLHHLADKDIPLRIKKQIRAWLVNEEYLPQKDAALYRIWQETEASTDENILTALHTTKRRIGLSKSVNRWTTRFYKYAAILLLPLITGIAVWTMMDQNQKELEMVECYVPNGEQRTVNLPDGSQIKVNSGTLLIYPKEFKGRARTIYLSGEACFSVIKDEKKPFVVRTGVLKVQVLGTKFNVESYPGSGRIVTTLKQGSVKVYKENIPEESIQLKPDQQLIYNEQNQHFLLKETNADESLAWTQGELHFYNQPLSEILKIIERRYNVSFRINAGLKLSDQYTMKFKQYETIDDVMRVFTQLAVNINYHIKGNDVFLYVKEEGGER